jgi:sugar phosphate isomerase/epimerase
MSDVTARQRRPGGCPALFNIHHCKRANDGRSAAPHDVITFSNGRLHVDCSPADSRFLTRRAVLAGLGVAAISPAAFAAGPNPRPPLRLSGSTIMFKTLPIEQAVARLAALGFPAVDIWSAHENCPHLDDVQQRLGPAGLRDLLARHKIALYAFSVYRGGYARYAKLLGESGGGVAVQGSTKPVPPSELTAAMKAYLESLKPLVELAHQNNSYLAIENHGHALLDSLDSIKAFVDLNRDERLGIALAPYHLQRRNESVEQAIATAGKQLLFFYAWQNATGFEQLPGVGPTDMRPWLRALEAAGYKHPISPFMHGEPEPDDMARLLATSCQALQRWHDDVPA